jgi:SAM-dependent methyltransferase
MPALLQADAVTCSGERQAWDSLASRPCPNWYLDPVVALQKKRIHQRLIRKWVGTHPSGLILKTDLFEDAWGLDAIIFDLFAPGIATLLGTDIAHATVKAAEAVAAPEQPLYGFVSDLRHLPLAPASLDMVVSTSTLDHFDNRAEFERTLVQICEALKPGGTLIITLDNPLNPLYPILRLASSTGLAPFQLGYSPTVATFISDLRQQGFDILDLDWLIHNPRVLSTVLILLVRRVCGRRAGKPIRWLLSLFAFQDRLRTRRFTACFYAVYARKRDC